MGNRNLSLSHAEVGDYEVAASSSRSQKLLKGGSRERRKEWEAERELSSE
jgi:hypothetical protein